MTLRLRELTDDERTEVQRITRSHTLGTAFVRRAQIVVHAMSGLKAEEIARRMDLCGNTVRYWINVNQRRRHLLERRHAGRFLVMGSGRICRWAETSARPDQAAAAA